jgi:F0F1-type ATP synthase alpha subunit
MAVEDVRGFEDELYRYVEGTNPGLLSTIMEKKVLDDALKAEMTKVIKQAKEAFVADRQAVGAGK